MFSLWFPYVALCFPYGLDVLLSKMLKEKKERKSPCRGALREAQGEMLWLAVEGKLRGGCRESWLLSRAG